MMHGVKPPAANATHTLPAQPTITNTPKSKRKKFVSFMKNQLLFNIESETTKKEGFFGTISRRKSKNTRPDISAPIQSTYVKLNFLGKKLSLINSS